MFVLRVKLGFLGVMVECFAASSVAGFYVYEKDFHLYIAFIFVYILFIYLSVYMVNH